MDYDLGFEKWKNPLIPANPIRLAVLFTMAVMFTLLSPLSRAAKDTSDYELNWLDNRTAMSLWAKQADVQQLLQQIAADMDLELWVSSHFKAEPLTLSFEALSLPMALGRILAGHSYVLTTDDEGDIHSLFVLPQSQSQAERVEIVAGSEQDLAIQRIMASDQLSDDMKTALLLQNLSHDADRKQRILERKHEVMSQLIQRIETMGQAKPETVERLRARLGERPDQSGQSGLP